MQFLARLDEVQEEPLYYPPALALAAAALAKSLTLKFLYVMGKALSGELSCPCDRSCFSSFLVLLCFSETIRAKAMKLGPGIHLEE